MMTTSFLEQKQAKYSKISPLYDKETILDQSQAASEKSQIYTLLKLNKVGKFFELNL
jgi:hypothetical protein